MVRRLDKTLADYLVIAISPILIMVLITSLMYFLLEVFYHGPHGERLHTIVALFVIGAVLVGRISIEEDRERASLFAIPLAVVTVLAINRFVDLSFLTNCGLIGLIWWCADKLTWDCTLIDETEPDSGEGLLQAVGLDEPASRKALLAPPPKVELEATTTRDAPPAKGEKGTGPICAKQPWGGSGKLDASPFRSWWNRMQARRRRPHAPGLWVVYFSLAALPLFGVGQLFIPSGDLAGRQYAFRLLCIYVASGLALLLATSFLGLRRYLRQRRLEMPVMMVNVWLAMGCALIVGVMAFAILLPRPNAEYPISKVPIRIGSPERKSSPYAMRGNGVEEKQSWARSDKIDPKGTLQSNQPGDNGQTASDQQKDNGQGEAGKQQGQSPSGKQDGNSQTRSGKQEGQGQSQPGKPESQGQSQPGAQAKPEPPAEPGAKSGLAARQAPGKPEAPPGDPSAAEKSPTGMSQSPAGSDTSRDDRSKRAAPSAPREESRPPPDQRPRPGLPKFSVVKVGDWFAVLAKLVLYAVLVALGAWWLWRHWATVLAALREFLQGWADFCKSLFGHKAKTGETPPAEADSKPSVLPRFADYVDPFLAGRANRYTPAQLVTYTFHALEAWARENGCARQPDHTPHEFAQNVGLHCPTLSDGARHLAELYCQLAYASGKLPLSSVESLRQLWQEFPR